jgi:hypothetical protein
MKHRIFFTGFLVMLCLAYSLYSQDTTARRFSFDGYLSFTESVMDLNVPGKDEYWESLLHNRLNFYYYPSQALSFSLQVRNRMIVSELLKDDFTDTYRKSFANDMGVVDLTWNLVSEKSVVYNIAIDRLWVKYSREKLEITAGRQRINWGLTYVWNPNDWFNNFSFFDIDYTERPGSDAVRIQYYTSAVSGLEAVVKIDSARHYTAAILFKTNFRQYDLQFLAGMLGGEDIALGLGWAGGIKNIGFRGEISYLHPMDHLLDTTGLFFISAGLDYTFDNSLALQGEVFYNQFPEGQSGKNFIDLYTRPLSVKNLSFSEFNFFAGVSYPFTPLFSGSLAFIYYPGIEGYYIGPTLTCSIADNLDIALFMQYFNGRFENFFKIEERQDYTMGFARMKFNF